MEPQVKELLAIPDGTATAATIAMGYPGKGFSSGSPAGRSRSVLLGA